MNTTDRIYETLYIVDPTLTDDQIEPIVAKYSKVISDQGGNVQAAGRWDKRRLAYEVKGRREGIYILMYFTGEPAMSKELDRLMKISDDVMRHIIVRVEPQHVDTSRLDRPQPATEAAAEAPAEVAAEVAEEVAAEEVEAPVEEAALEAAEPVEAEAAEEPVATEPAPEVTEEVAEEAPVEEPAEEPAVEEPAVEETPEEIAGEEPKVEPEKESE